MQEANLAILWHQHQPYYLDPIRNAFSMPWVRLHGVKDYWGMARMLQAHPDCHVTINLVPSLIAQLERYVEGPATDRPLELAVIPAADLSGEERIDILNLFFHANRERMIAPLPRYKELLDRRCLGTRSAADVEARFSPNDIRDLQLLFHLAWTHPLAAEDFPLVGELKAKGRGFSEEDKKGLLQVHAAILSQIIPMHKRLAEMGILELTTSPFYHPILPLLYNSRSTLEAMPGAQLPPLKDDTPEDADRQVAAAVEFFESRFGWRPKGMWPSEGAVSQEILPILARHGIRWIGTDEEVLYRSISEEPGQSAPGESSPSGGPLDRTCPYELSEGMAAVFRDHKLSDKIGFQYYGMTAKDAVPDFINNVLAVAQASGEARPLVCVFLDGENAWEHYANYGQDFLNLLYTRIVQEKRIKPTTVGDYLARNPPKRKLKRLFAGSWIDHNFAIWIGHAEDRKAWDYLGQVRRYLVAHGRGDEARTREAWEELYVAEGSDWFWWYGDDHFSGMDEEFDRLFRLHLKNVYLLLNAEPPAFLDDPIAAAARRETFTRPVALMESNVDGRVSSYLEWLPAGHYARTREAGTMERLGRTPISDIYFGFGARTLFLRIDPDDRRALLGDDEIWVQVDFVAPAGVRLVIRNPVSSPTAALVANRDDKEERHRCNVAVNEIIEAAIPFDVLGVSAGNRITFFVEVYHGRQLVQKAPGTAPIELECPSEEFDQIMWSV